MRLKITSSRLEWALCGGGAIVASLIGLFALSVSPGGTVTGAAAFAQFLTVPFLIGSCGCLLYGLFLGLDRHGSVAPTVFGAFGSILLFAGLSLFLSAPIRTIGVLCIAIAGIFSILLPSRIRYEERDQALAMLEAGLSGLPSAKVSSWRRFQKEFTAVKGAVIPVIFSAVALFAATAVFQWLDSSLRGLPVSQPSDLTAVLPVLRSSLLALFLLAIGVTILGGFLYVILQYRTDRLRLLQRRESEQTSFVRVAADTLRTPLTGIRWMSELMLSGDLGNISPEQRENVTSVGRSVERLIVVTDELLRVIKMSHDIIHYHPAPADINVVIGNAMEIISHVARGRKVPLAFGKLSKDFGIMLDVPLVSHVLETLLTNTVALATPGQELIIHVEPVAKETIIGITYKGPVFPFKADIQHDGGEQMQPFLETESKHLVDMAVSWEILRAADARFWTRDGEGMDTEHTLFVALPR